MIKKDFQKDIVSLNWSNTEAAKMLGISRKSVYNYWYGISKIPPYVEIMLNLYKKVRGMGVEI